MGDFNHVEANTNKLINPKTSALFVFLLLVLVYLFFALDTAEAETININVAINGQTMQQATTYHTVGDLVDSLYADAKQVNSVFPGRDTELTANLTVDIKTAPVSQNPIVIAQLEAAKSVAVEKPATPPAVKPKPVPAKVVPKSPTYSGTATWYKFGNGLTTASTQFPKGTHLRVVADASGRYVDVEVNDYGPTADTGVTLDLNKPAFAKLAPTGAGKINVRYYVI